MGSPNRNGPLNIALEQASYSTNLCHIAHITVDEKAEVGEVDIGWAFHVEVVKPLNVKRATKRQNIEMIKYEQFHENWLNQILR